MNRMKRKIIPGIYVFLFLFPFLNSCIDDTFNAGEENIDENKVKVSLNFILPDQKVVETGVSQSKTSFESYIGDLYLLVFDENQKFIECVQAVNAGSSSGFFASLTRQDRHCQIYIVANAPRVMAEKKGSWNSTTTLEQIRQYLLKPSILNNDVDAITSLPEVPPLASILPIGLDGIRENLTLEDVVLERATAKIVVTNELGADLIIEGANLCNAPVQGYVFPGQPYASIPVADYWGADESGFYPDLMICRATPSNPLYVYETDQSQGCFMIVKANYKGVDGFYRIDFIDETGKVFSLKRNHSYEIKIKRVQHPGFRSPDEAKKNPPLNRTAGNVDVEVSDPYSHNIVSNGDYYLGVENSEYIVYSPEALNNEFVTKVSSNAPSTVLSGSAVINAFDLFGTQLYNGVTIQNPFPEVNNSSIQTGDLKISLPANAATAVVRLRIGNLEKSIRIVKKSENISFGGSIKLDDEYVFGKISNPQPWIKFSTKEDSELHDGRDFIENEGGRNRLYLALASNILQAQGAANRDALLFLSRANENGRTKIRIHQSTFDIFDKEEKPIENPYVGTFHRHNQTGERVIKMGDANTTVWIAEVVSGKDFIKLKKGGSEDPEIYKRNPGDAERFQIYNDPAASTSVIGSGEILFRVGLKNTIAPNQHRYGVILVTHPGGTSRIFVRQGEAPDYLYRMNDPVLIPWTAHPGTPRPLTVKLSPYNLTDPRLGKNYTSVKVYKDYNSMPLNYHPESGVYQEFDKNKFTEYPTQAGYLFIWNTLTQPVTGSEYPYSSPTTFKDEWQWVRACHPFLTAGMFGAPRSESISWSGNNTYEGNYSGNGDGFIPLYDMAGIGNVVSSYNYTQIGVFYNKETDPCPYGYRMPKAGLVDTSPGGGPVKVYGQDAYNSELLQSMFYDPHISTNESIMSQYTLWGYYADGFFDRRLIQNVTIGIDAGAKAIVVNGDDQKSTSLTGNDIGYAGGLTFNPFTFASIFHPAAGYWLYGIRSIGREYHYWTTDRASSVRAGGSVPMFLIGAKSRFNLINSSGLAGFPKSIRCVRDMSIPIMNYPEYD